LVRAAMSWESPDLVKFGGFLLLAFCSAGMRFSIPGLVAALSPAFLFVLCGVIDLTVPENIVLGTVVTLAQCFWDRARRPRLAQIVFNVTNTVLAIEATELAYHAAWLATHQVDPAIRLALATTVYFLANTVPVVVVIALAEDNQILRPWFAWFLPSFPYYLGGAAVAQIASVLANRFIGWQTVLLMGPVIYLIYRSYRLYLERLEQEKRYAEDVSSLHLRTIEALALAIEAKDHTTHDHLRRVQVYAMEMANDLNLTDREKDALRAAALLHDIGKLAVPEHIISKPGRLSAEEFEKMKIHPLVGAEILERVQFPYPVVPIVRAHHEKWNGTGYPFGLAGEEIPIGARILSVVDCLDALATDRQYRRALPLDDAMQVVIRDSGSAFDPKVVEVLKKRYVELEAMAQARRAEPGKLSTQVKVAQGVAPAAGFEKSGPQQSREAPVDFLTSIASARQEVQALFEISQDLGNSLSLDETLSVLAVRLGRIIPYHALAIWVRRENVLIPDYVTGEDSRLFSSLEIPLGQGLSGWVAENRKPILNGNPSVESGYLNDPNRFSTMSSAVAVPLEGMNGVVGVLSLYQFERDAFTKDHVRIMLAISSKIGLSIENALKFRQVESSATTDYLTSLPNARSLFLQLDAELSRRRRTGEALAVLVLDLDGFKLINDRFGHLEGNRVLRAVASGLRGACREYDYVARMGGDEFVVILPGVKANDIEGKMAQFRAVVTSIGREMFGNDRLTVSIGAAHCPASGTDAEQLLSEADRRMYKEKHLQEHARSAFTTPGVWSTTVQ